MTNGAIIFAQNNATVDYTKLAVFAASRVKKYLDVPVSLITDNPDWLERAYPDHVFDQVIKVDYTMPQPKRFNDGTMSSKTVEWRNSVRDKVFDLTPYDRTLVLDSDVVLCSGALKPAFDNHYDFQIYQKSMDLAQWRPTADFERINEFSVPFYWATTFLFEKNTITKAFFDLITYIKSNWIYFRALYSIPVAMFRNDIAFSIAIHIMNGKTNGGFATELPGKMIYSMDTDLIVSMEDDTLKFLIEKKNYLGEYTLAKTKGLDVHVMNKYSLTRCIDGGTGV